MPNFETLDIRPFVNNRGMTLLSNCAEGDLSIGGSSLPAEEIPLDQEFMYSGVAFRFCYEESGDNIAMEGQTIAIPTQTFSKLHVIGVAGNGSLADYLQLLRDGQEVERLKIGLSDFVETTPQLGDEQALTLKSLHTKVGKNESYQPNLWYYTVDLPKAVTCNGIGFEYNPFLHLFAVTFEE